ncbi:hypothetical protein EUGRSUZ_C01099 [Eucalyptus grandis]|uniref:Uncharacterized protein n=2 Tax=Eucalyptus grandis TaxID=71139 RepID=A0ACC3LCR0_EUCGR|nr:hypothetical protein EUGRSUZ_C01099 [Eucalyptus grandis]
MCEKTSPLLLDFTCNFIAKQLIYLMREHDDKFIKAHILCFPNEIYSSQLFQGTSPTGGRILAPHRGSLSLISRTQSR